MAMDTLMSNYMEVENVISGGLGTVSEPLDRTWDGRAAHTTAQTMTTPQITSSPRQVEPLLSLLPFAGEISVTDHLCPARPVLKTNNLKELLVTIGNKQFIDRELPPPAKGLAVHDRFTPAYYVALHNLVAAAGYDGNGFSYPPGTHNYMGARIPLVHTGLDIKAWRKHLIGYGEAGELLQFLEFGFPLGLVQLPELESCERNHGSSYQYFHHIDKFITGEIKKGGLTGPFTTPPMQDLIVSPLMTAPKKPQDRRPVFDATFGQNSLNNATPSDFYLGMPTIYTYPKIEDFRNMVLKCGPGCYMWKRDLSRFFLQLPMDPVEFNRVGFIWRGLIFIFVSLMFGLRHSGFQGQRVTDAVTWRHRQLGLETPEESAFNCCNYSDDIGGVEVTRSRAMLSFNSVARLLGELGLAESESKARPPSSEMTYLGVQFNSSNMTMSVPPEKLAEIKSVIIKWVNKTTATKKPLQSLLGQLFWVSKCVRHSRVFMGRLLAQLRELSAKPDNFRIKLSDDCRKDLMWWDRFLKVFNGIVMIKNEEAIPLPIEQLIDKPSDIVAGDATLTGGGAWHGNLYWSRQFPFQLCDPKIPVHVKEFLVVIVSIKLWGEDWTGRVVQIFCDNDPVVEVIAGERPKDPKMLSLLREFVYLVCTLKFYPVMRKISSADNFLADHISRRFDHAAAQSLFSNNGLPEMTLVDVPDKLFDMIAPW